MRSEGLNYQFVSGCSRYDIGPHEIRGRILPFCVAVSVHEGEYYVELEDKTLCIHAGESVLIQSFVPHNVRMLAAGRLTYAHFLCRYEGLDIMRLSGADWLISGDAQLQQLFCLLSEPPGEGIKARLHTDSTICRIFLHLMQTRQIDAEKLCVEPWLRKAIRKIDEGLMRGITVEEVVEESGISRSVFFPLFQSRMNCTPHEYIEAERMRAASIMLLAGKKVKDAAAAAGFEDVSYFTKVFRRKYGTVPSEHRKKGNEVRGKENAGN